MELYTNLREGEKGAWISIGVYLLLSTLKLSVGIIGSSEALKADGLNNFTDIIASVAILIGLRISQKPPDKHHQYGHLRAETIASLVAAFIMAFIGIQVLIQAVQHLANPIQESPSLLTAIVALFSAIIMYIVYRYNLNLGNRINSAALKAAAYDNRSDALVSIGATIGIVGSILGFPLLDGITALLVGIIIIYTAYTIFHDAAYTLSDGFNVDEAESLSTIVRLVEGVDELTDFKARMHGNLMFVDITVTVDPNLNVLNSHRITEEIEHRIMKVKPFSVILVHIEPNMDLLDQQ
ncbi:cation diffusion facilitator family transporter [Psychrobacillus psychrotolerans]|uniref:Cation diffusion facilitator family transporter n=1 Tax=Psychrobacillus psychrotolerans TaxID=126156 RepID=A0A1I6B8D7_9BACI|nr:cation diffusion facilitator family transporter [Psychrobacillus psychrotolerans]SFQ77164.1 cation diffusion facilitator family transporter [Psychrobacillus psychrotolerans]